MTDCIHLLKNNTRNVIIRWAPLPSGLPRLIWLYPCLKLFQHACIFHIWNVCLAWNGKWHACWSLCKRFKIYIFFANKYFYLSRRVWTTMQYLYFNSLAWKQLSNTNLKSQFLEIELVWAIHRSHRTYDWRDIISSEDSALVRMTTNNYHMLSLCMKCISIELFHTKRSSSLFANCDLLPSCTMDSKQPANNLMYSKHKKDIFSRTQRKLFPVWMRKNYNSFFPLPGKSRYKCPKIFTFFLLLFNS